MTTPNTGAAAGNADTNENSEGTKPGAEGQQAKPPEQSQSQQQQESILHTEEETTDEQKPDPKGAPAKASEATPKDIEVKLPDGVDAGFVEAFKPVFKELGLDSAKAQKLVDHFLKQDSERASERAAAAQRQAEEQRVAQSKQFLESLRTDKEFGGAAFQENVTAAKKALVAFGSKELSGLFQKLGVENHPLLVKAFAKVGKAIGEDSIAGRNGAPPVKQTDEDLHRKLYPTMFKDAAAAE